MKRLQYDTNWQDVVTYLDIESASFYDQIKVLGFMTKMFNPMFIKDLDHSMKDKFVKHKTENLDSLEVESILHFVPRFYLPW